MSGQEFIVTDPSGKEFVVTAPEGATPDQALEFAKSQFGSTPGGAATGNPNATRAPGVPSLSEAAANIGTAGTLGTAMGAAAPEILQGLGRAAQFSPYTRAIAPFLESAGVALKGARGSSAIAGGLSGAGSEIAGQGAEAAGAGPVLAEGVRFASGAITPGLVSLGSSVLRRIVNSPLLGGETNMVAKETAREILKKLESAPQDLSIEERRTLDGLIADLHGSERPGAPAQAVYSGLEQGAVRTQAVAAQDAQGILASADEQAKNAISSAMRGDVARLRAGQQRLNEIGSGALATAQASRGNIGADRDLTDIGESLRGAILKRNEAALTKRVAEDSVLREQVQQIVAGKEAAGNLVEDTPGYKKLLAELDAKTRATAAARMQTPLDTVGDTSLMSSYNMLRDAIRTKSVMVGEAEYNAAQQAGLKVHADTNPHTGEPAFYRDFPTSFEALDNVRRKLGEVFRGQPPEGYAAISADDAKKFYGQISDIQKSYAGAPQQALLERYAQNTAGLEPFRSKTGKLATATDKYNDEEFVTNAAALPRRYFANRDGISALTALTGDPQLVTQAAREYAANQLAGKTESQVRSWMVANRELIGTLPEVRDSVLNYANTLATGERIAKNTARGIDVVAKREADTIREAERFADQLRAAGQREAGAVTGAAEKTAQTLLGNEAAVKRVRTLIESGKVDQWTAAGPAIYASAPARQAVFDAVKQVLADSVTTPTSAKGLQRLYAENIQPFVESSRLVTPAQSQEIMGKLSAIQNMQVPEAQKLGIAQRLLLQSISGYAASVGARGLMYAIPQ